MDVKVVANRTLPDLHFHLRIEKNKTVGATSINAMAFMVTFFGRKKRAKAYLANQQILIRRGVCLCAQRGKLGSEQLTSQHDSYESSRMLVCWPSKDRTKSS